MLIRFKAPDPRAGMEAQMDSDLGRAFIDAGNAEAVAPPEKKAELPEENKAIQAAPENKGRKPKPKA